jgi:gliding motility-associated protein GldM
MGGGKETPRQKMIGMMYLVLTALLAMNVSKTVLMGYIRVNEGMERSRDNLNDNNKRVSEAFQKSLDGNSGAKPYYTRAQETQKEFEGLISYIEKVKSNVYFHTEKLEKPEMGDTIQLKHRVNGAYDNYDEPTAVLIGSDEKNPAAGPLTASELKTKMEELHNNLLKIVEKMQKTDGEHLFPADYENLKKKLANLKPHASGDMEDGFVMSWEMENFYHLPEAAVIANLTKMQVDIKNAEAEILQVFSSASGKLSIKPDKLIAKVIAPSSYIQAGQEYTADIFLSASFSKLAAGDMEVLMGVDSTQAKAGSKGSNSLPIVDGQGKYKVGTSGQGDQKYKGVIRFKKPDGTFEIYPFEQEYKVAPPAAAVAADQMNVFYAGVPNPVTASSAGIAPADILINPTGAGVKYTQKSPGKYEFTFTGTGECMITVSAKTAQGVKVQGPPIKFRVKPLPKPDAKIGGKFAPAEMKKGDLSTVSAIGAGAQGFDFQANYITMSYEVTGKVKGQVKVIQGTGSTLSADAQNVFKQAEVGSKIYIELKVKGPDQKIYPTLCAIKVIR